MAEVKKIYPIKGMHCASCVGVIERSLSKTPGIKTATVNLATEKATVTYDDLKCTPDQIASAVANIKAPPAVSVSVYGSCDPLGVDKKPQINQINVN